MKLAGDKHKFQIRTLKIISYMNFVIGFIAYSIPFWFYQPQYYCIDKKEKYFKCTKKNACKDSNYQIKFDFYSLMQEYSLYCDRSNMITLANSLIFTISSILTIFLCLLTDKIGRKKSLIISKIIIIFGILLVLLNKSLFFSIGGIIIIWSGADFFYSINFIYINELIGDNLRSKATTICYSCYALGGIFLYLITILIKNYRTIFYIQLVFVIISLFLFRYLTETPFHSFNKLNRKNFIKSINYIATINNMNNEFDNIKNLTNECFDNKTSELNELKKSKKESVSYSIKIKLSNYFYDSSFYSLFSNIKNIINFISITMIFGYSYIIFGMMLIISKDIGIDNININGIILGITELIGYVVIIPYISLIPRKMMTNISLFIISFFSGILFYFSQEQYNHLNHIKSFKTIFTGFIKIILCSNMAIIFNHAAEIFETKTRMIACGFAIFTARMLSGISPYLYAYSIEINIHPMGFSILICLIAFPFSLLLPETLNKKMKS